MRNAYNGGHLDLRESVYFHILIIWLLQTDVYQLACRMPHSLIQLDAAQDETDSEGEKIRT